MPRLPMKNLPDKKEKGDIAREIEKNEWLC